MSNLRSLWGIEVDLSIKANWTYKAWSPGDRFGLEVLSFYLSAVEFLEANEMAHLFIHSLNVYWVLSTHQAHMRRILVFCGGNYHKFSSFKQHTFIISRFSWWEVWVGWACSYATDFTRLISKCLCRRGCVIFWSLWRWICLQPHSGCWQKPAPWGCRTEGPSPARQLWSALSTLRRRDISVSAPAGEMQSSVSGGKGKCAPWAIGELVYTERNLCPWSLISPSSPKWRLQILTVPDWSE